MRGRLEHKVKMEHKLQDKINGMPDYMTRFYYSMNQKSHTTKNVYIGNVLRFLQFQYGETLPSLNELRNLNSFDIQKYMEEIKYYEKANGEIHELKESSQAAIYSSISAFFTFLNRAYQIENNPFANKMIERPTIPENMVVYLTPEEVRKVEKQILEGVGNQTSISKQKAWKYRDLLLFRIPVVNGLRVTALCEINIEDIDFKNNKITVTEKRNITKKVDFDPKTASYLKLWLRQRSELLGTENRSEKALFISNRRTRMTVRAIEKIIAKYTDCIDGKHITPHKLRSTCGTNNYQASGDIYLVSKILGHKTTAPTRKYAAVLETDKTDSINKVAMLY